VASDFPDCLRIVEERVKPERANNNDKRRREIWWQFTRPTFELYKDIRKKSEILTACRHTKYLAHSLTAVGPVFDVALNVIVLSDGHPALAVLDSTIYEKWVREYGSSLETRLRYTLEDCFETHPLPCTLKDTEITPANLCTIGHAYHSLRKKIMLARQEGLTKIYNRFHDQNETNDEIQKFRQLQVEMDNAVAAAYGWSDIDLGHGFHETKQGVRYTISEPARRKVLALLLKLNHDRYEEEVRHGLHEKKKSKTTKGRKRQTATEESLKLFH
jgi:hypothetical protein